VSPDEARALPNVSLIVPNVDKDRLVQIANSELQIANRVAQIANGVGHIAKDEPLEPDAIRHMPYAILDADVETQVAGNSPISNPQSPISSLRTRAFVKIQDGCNMSCTYCIIPMARGKEQSRSLVDVVADVRSLVNAGYKEIILTGVQISSFRNVIANAEGAKQSSSFVEIALHKSLAMTNGLRDLVAAILAETSVPRLRLTSIAPWDLDESLLDLFTDSRLCRHLHLSLQAGSDTVLRRMRRPYTTAQFARAVELARAKIPDVGITTDVIVGFPGESATEFEQSLEFVDRMQFSRVHVFPYSARAGTVAAKLPLPVDEPTKSMRMKQMQAIADFSQRAFANRFVGRTLNVLWESRQATEDQNSSVLRPLSSVWVGYTDNYIRVVAPSDDDLRNQITPARLISVVDDGAIGEVIRKYPK
jgi:threonylcarbamoyladenosine tRNA methylthiotransferase MtaB